MNEWNSFLASLNNTIVITAPVRRPPRPPSAMTIADTCIEVLIDGPATTADIVNVTGKNSKRVSAALCELYKLGKIRKVSEIKRGKRQSGRTYFLWALME